MLQEMYVGYCRVLEYNLEEEKLKHPGKMDGKGEKRWITISNTV